MGLNHLIPNYPLRSIYVYLSLCFFPYKFAIQTRIPYKAHHWNHHPWINSFSYLFLFEISVRVEGPLSEHVDCMTHLVHHPYHTVQHLVEGSRGRESD